jgi:hypothetical protein
VSLHDRLFEQYDYEAAGSRAQPEVQQAIERFRKLPLVERKRHPLLYWLLGESTPAFKMSKEDSNYQPVPQGKQRCDNCEFAYKKVVRNQFICSQIEGDIEPKAWCRLWRASD